MCLTQRKIGKESCVSPLRPQLDRSIRVWEQPPSGQHSSHPEPMDFTLPALYSHKQPPFLCPRSHSGHTYSYFLHVHLQMCVCVYVCVFMEASVHGWMCLYFYKCVCVCVCMCDSCDNMTPLSSGQCEQSFCNGLWYPLCCITVSWFYRRDSFKSTEDELLQQDAISNTLSPW